MYLKLIPSPWNISFLNILEWVSAHCCRHRNIYTCLQKRGKSGQYHFDLRNLVWHDVNGVIMKPFHEHYLLHFILFLTTISVHVMTYFGVIFVTSLHQYKHIFWDLHQEIQALHYLSMVFMIHWTIYNICQPYQKLSSIKDAWD